MMIRDLCMQHFLLLKLIACSIKTLTGAMRIGSNKLHLFEFLGSVKCDHYKPT